MNDITYGTKFYEQDSQTIHQLAVAGVSMTLLMIQPLL
jgi:hypothetical protein